ncbi:MAG: hypothetical protein ACI4ME_10920 [Aristaeellaceae bacterium]
MSDMNVKGEKRAKRPSMLNRFFHHIDRGSTTGREISAGLVMCILSVCGMFINMQLIGQYQVSGPALTASVEQLAANGEFYAQFYFLSMMLAFIGSLLMGLIARLPLAQTTGLGLSTVMISTLGLGTGLSYQNLMAVCFVSAAVYTLLLGVPAVRRAVLRAIPQCVRRAAPIALGVMLVMTALQLTGLVSFGDSNLTIYGTGTSVTRMDGIAHTVQTSSLFDFTRYQELGYKADAYFPVIQWSLWGVAAAITAFLLLRRTKHPTLWALLIGTGVFFIGLLTQVVFYFSKSGQLRYDLDVLWGRLWMVGSEDALHFHLGTILRKLSVGELFREGFDFSAYTAAGGNVVLLFVTGLLTFLCAAFAGSDAMLQDADAEDAAAAKALLCHGAMNVVSPLLGMTPVEISPASAAGRRDGARSGLASVAAAIGFLISAFVWVIPFVFCTTTSYDIVFNMYGHYGKVLQLLTDSSFIVADGVMALVGLMMIHRALRHDWSNTRHAAPMLAMAAAAFFLNSLACGMAAGLAAHLLTNLFDRERELTIANIAAGVLGLALLVLTALC